MRASSVLCTVKQRCGTAEVILSLQTYVPTPRYVQQRHVIGADCITRLHTRSENYTVCFMQVPLQPPQCSCHMVLATHIRNTEIGHVYVRTYVQTVFLIYECIRTYILTPVDSQLVTHTHLFIYFTDTLLPVHTPSPLPSYTHSPPLQSHPLTPPQLHPLTLLSHTHSFPLQSHPLTPPSHTHSPLPVTPTHLL